MSRSSSRRISNTNSSREETFTSNKTMRMMRRSTREDIWMLKRAEENSSNGFKKRKPSNTSNQSSEGSSGASKVTTLSPSTPPLSERCAHPTSNHWRSLTTTSRTPTPLSLLGSPSSQ